MKATLSDHCFKEILWLVCWEQGSLTIPSILNYEVMFILWGLYLAFLLLFPFLGSVYFWFLPFPTSRSPSSVSSLHSLCIPSSSPSSSSGSHCLSSSPTPPKTHFHFLIILLIVSLSSSLKLSPLPFLSSSPRFFFLLIPLLHLNCQPLILHFLLARSRSVSPSLLSRLFTVLPFLLILTSVLALCLRD